MSKHHTNNSIIKFFGSTAKELNNSGVVLFITVVVAMVWANSPWKEYYIDLMQTDIAFTVGSLQLSEPLLLWINDGLMALFFLQVGLELKREIIGGKLSSPKDAVLPIGAAIGGMVLPALVYFMFNSSGEASNGWGIPMATDIAFSLGVLALVGKRLPASLRVFLITLAIIGNYAGVRSTWFYAIIGIGGVWLAFFFSGVHPTIAGILTAFAIPGRVKIKENTFLERLDRLHKRFQETKSIKGTLISKTQLEILEDIKTISSEAETPLQKLERTLNPIVSFVILPLFALANAGIHLHGDLLKVLSSPVSLGIGLGLIFGKFIGITAFSRLLVAFKLAKLPENVNWNMIYGVAFLGGIGFTMSLFINELAFTDESLIFTAKVSILFASMIAGVMGTLLLHRSGKKLLKVNNLGASPRGIRKETT